MTVFWRRHALLIGVIGTISIAALGWLTHSDFDQDDDDDRIGPLLGIWGMLIIGWPVYVLSAWIVCRRHARPPNRALAAR